MISSAPPSFISGLSDLTDRYRLLLCDIWGVVHGGVAAFPAAADALVRFRRAGGHVVLVSNAPRPAASVELQLTHLGLPTEAYDTVLTSGDVSRHLIAARAGRPLHHLGPERDVPLFAGLDAPRVDLDEADYVVCTGLFDDTTETPAHYADTFARMKAKNLPMLCANPDLVVDRAGQLIYCAGALGLAYQEAGGEVTLAGKPYPEIYDAVFKRVAPLGLGPADALAVGDSIRTDVTGAVKAGIASLFIVSGIHKAEAMPAALFAQGEIDAWLALQAARPTFVAEHLAW